MTFRFCIFFVLLFNRLRFIVFSSQAIRLCHFILFVELISGVPSIFVIKYIQLNYLSW